MGTRGWTASHLGRDPQPRQARAETLRARSSRGRPSSRCPSAHSGEGQRPRPAGSEKCRPSAFSSSAHPDPHPSPGKCGCPFTPPPLVAIRWTGLHVSCEPALLSLPHPPSSPLGRLRAHGRDPFGLRSLKSTASVKASVKASVDGAKGRGQQKWGATMKSPQKRCEGAFGARLPVSEACVCYLQMTSDLTSSCLSLHIFF